MNSDTLLNAFTSIAPLPAESRGEAIRSLSGDLARWRTFLSQVFIESQRDEGADAGPDAGSLFALARANGLRREDAKQLIATVIHLEPITRHWANWTQTLDRDELRLRLEILARARDWSEDFAVFVTFFFRASVADLYQPAAVVLGRHLHHSPKLRHYLVEYSQQRSLPLDQPVQLGGSRTARRTLIALAAARGNPPDNLTLCRDPLAVDALPRAAADLATALLALEVMLDAEPHDETLRERTRSALNHTLALQTQGETDAGAAGAAISRAVAQRFGGLLARCAFDDTDSLWRKMLLSLLEELNSLDHGRFGRRVAGLFKIDELIHAASVMPDPWPQRIIDGPLRECSPMNERYLTARLLTWAAREHGRLPNWTEPLIAAAESAASHGRWQRLSLSTIVSLLEQTVAAQAQADDQLVAQPTTHREIALLNDLLGELQTPAAWLSHDESERATMAMILIDAAQHVRMHAEQVSALLVRHGFDLHENDLTSAGGGSASETSEIASRGGAGRSSLAAARVSAANPIATSVLLRLLTWEKPGAEDLIDVRMVHRIDDVRVLLALIPTARRSALLPSLADALEHQIRWRLRREATFSPDVFLSLTLIRKPHRALYQLLLGLCEGRTYRRADSSELALVPLVRHIADEAAWTAAAPVPSVVPFESPFAVSLGHLRNRLQHALEPTDDPRDRIEGILVAVGDPTDRTHARPGTVVNILLRPWDLSPTTSPGGGPLLQDGHPAWSPQKRDEILHALDSDLRRIRAMTESLWPTAWSEGDAVREAVTALRSMLSQRLYELARYLPLVESELLKRAQHLIDAELAAWDAMIEMALTSRPESIFRASADGELNVDAFSDAMNAIARIRHPLMRGRLLELLWQSLLGSAGDGGSHTGDGWAARRHSLDAAIAYPLRRPSLSKSKSTAPAPVGGSGEGPPFWSDADRVRAGNAFVATWIELLNEAMERHEERRVIELATDDRYLGLRRHAAAESPLRAVRKWCHDRYLLREASRVRNDLAAASEQPARGLLAECGPFLLNFPTIWLAMLVGSIFMLDFGDAWSAMADPEVADVRGITITFLIGVAGAFGYVFWNLRQKSVLSPGESRADLRRSQLIRAGAFSAACLIYTLLLVTGLWWLLSRTDAVVQGVWAIGHIIVWSGFALFVGVFLGLLAGDA
jgi:hypothetical protein